MIIVPKHHSAAAPCANDGGAGMTPSDAMAASHAAPTPPPAPVRGDPFFRRVDDLFAALDGWIARWLPAEFNPLAHAGAAANVALLIAVASGVLLLIWYSPSLQFAYPSLAAIQGRTLGGTVRALHRYSSDLTMLFLVVHAGRVFFARKFGGARWLPWVSGIAMLALIWFIGWTGYWLAWDQPAQQVAVSSIQLLDALPIFGEPLGRLFILDRTVPSLLFFVVFFLHMLLPLAIAIGLAVHLARVSRARLLPRWGVCAALLGGLVVASFALPAPLDEPAHMTAKAAAFSVDAWYLSPLALALRFQHAGLWVALAGGVGLGALVPWLLGRRVPRPVYQATVDLARCHACTQCVQDCPFDAITMVARTDGKRFPSQAQVDPLRCVGCGVCAGSCDSEGIGLGWFDTRVQEARLAEEITTAIAARRASCVAFVAAEIRGPVPTLAGYDVHRVPTASWVRPKFLERLFTVGVRGVLVLRDARAEAWARDGGRWVAARLAGERKPILRPERAAGGAWHVADYDPSRPADVVRLAEEFRRGVVRRAAPSRSGFVAASLALAVIVGGVTVAPSHLRVNNPAPAAPELVLSFKAFGARVAAAAPDAAAEAAKPVHMRGRTLENPRRADITLSLTIDAVTEQRTFPAKGLSHDGPAIGEWRMPWTAGDHYVVIEIDAGTPSVARWEGTLRATERRLNVITYDPAAGFVVE